MKRLYPALLVLASLVAAAVFTTVFSVTLASYAKDGKPSNPTQQISGIDHSTAKK